MSKRKKGQGYARPRGDGKWQGEIWCGKDPLGKHKRLYHTGDTPEEALAGVQKKYEEYLREASSPARPLSPALTIQKFVEDYWRPSVRQGVSARTYERYKLDSGYVVETLGPIPLGELQSGAILAAVEQMRLAGKTDYQLWKTVKILRRILAHAVREGLLTRNVAAHIKLPRYEKGEITPLTEEQIARLLEANKGERMYPFYVLALDTGARLGELFALEWTDWNPQTRELSITKSVEQAQGTQRLKKPKTRAGKRMIVVGQKAARELEFHRQYLEEAREAGEAPPSALIFPNSDGHWQWFSNFHRDHWKPALKRAGLSGFRFHDLRHTTATLLLRKRIDVRTIADRLGHANPAMILEVYGHVTPKGRREAGEGMDEYL